VPGPKKIINLISNISNGAGLEKDTNLLASLLESMGHTWRKIAYDRPFEGLNYPADINIFVEIMVAGMLNYAPINYFCPNSEWYDAHTTECALPRINMILCKTHDCEAIWGKKLGRTFYTGFEAADLSNNTPILNKEIAFLHLAGNSGTKNTDAVINCWRQYAPNYPVTIVSRDPAVRVQCHGVRNVKYEQRLADSHVANAINSFRFHLMPSEYEGYGQGMHEALGCGGIVLTTNAAPMTEFLGIPAELMIPPIDTFLRRGLALCHHVSPEGVRDAVERAAALSDDRLIQLSLAARAGFENERIEFRQRIARLLNS
jgi:hypothetical protein